MIARTPPMGWNTWNTFGFEINEQMVMETADMIISDGYKDAGYEYVVIDDCWLLMARDENGDLVADPKKFPHGMKYVADYVHSKGLKFGMYTCAGVRTCQGFPASYDHEYQDARYFAEIGVDLLKYDFCNFPNYADNKNRYLTMSMALKSTGRDIVFSACNWGRGEPWNWMRSIGAHMYRSTGDIFDTYESFSDIIRRQIDNMNANAPGCFNDIDMLTVGMYGNGLVGRENTCTFDEYATQFAFWCFAGAPLMMGCDIRKLDPTCKKLLQNKHLIELDQDSECRPLYQANGTTKDYPIMIRFLENNDIALAFFNLKDADRTLEMPFPDLGLQYHSGVALDLNEILLDEEHLGETKYYGQRRDDMRIRVKAHSCRIFRAKLVTL